MDRAIAVTFIVFEVDINDFVTILVDRIIEDILIFTFSFSLEEDHIYYENISQDPYIYTYIYICKM